MTTIEKTEIGQPMKFGNQTLLPIEETLIQHDANGASCWCYCSKQLIALVVETPAGILAFDSDARQLTIRDLKRLAPDIGAHLNHYS